MRNAFAESLYQAAVEDDRVSIVVADISPAGSMVKFQEECPERFINVGVAEQNMIGICAGMALKGFRPFAYTIATFTLYRPFEMVRDDLCYQNLPVTVVGMGSGIVYSTLGGTHHTQEDIAIAGALPNMQILTPCDPAETMEMTRYCALENKGPMYFKLGKAGEPVLTGNALDPFEFGKVRRLREGRDICVLSHGPIMSMAMEIADTLEVGGASVSVLNVHTLKPLDREGIAKALRDHKTAIVIEEHAPRGGLAPMTKQIAWDEKATCQLHTFTLKDEFIHCYGSHDDLRAKHGLDKDTILAAVRAGG
ncbi:MAG: transketolase [Rhodospirillales bacterium]|nr:transketolase [Rhodospirillales bacterium]